MVALALIAGVIIGAAAIMAVIVWAVQHGLRFF